eukprot:11357453-Alexandrium_andersonii.AAC.1
MDNVIEARGLVCQTFAIWVRFVGMTNIHERSSACPPMTSVCASWDLRYSGKYVESSSDFDMGGVAYCTARH